MNKTAIKNFAIWARNKLIADVSYKAGLMGINEKGILTALPQSTAGTQFYDIGLKEPYAISGNAVGQRQRLKERITRKAAYSDYKTAYDSVMEEAAYTWFNRLIAIRFMEVNDYLPSHMRALSSDSPSKIEPDMVTNPFDTDFTFTREENETILRYQEENKVDELFQLLFIKQCNALNELLPKLFEKTADYTELLLSLSVTDPDGVVYRLVHDIPEEDFNISTIGEDGKPTGQVEIIGWLYQYYNTEPKDETFALLKKNVKITKERIPSATQLFTPDWIVRYMVENSLGRLWIEGHSSQEASMAKDFGWQYYLPEASQEPDVQKQLDAIRAEFRNLKPEDIKIIDPCMGSGHILVYAFDVLMQIYESQGYMPRDAAKSILEHNLYGLDIDDRAFQLAYFSILMKARQYNRRILQGDTPIHVYAIQESNAIDRNQLEHFGTHLPDLERHAAREQLNNLLDTFNDAKEYGSILNVGTYDWELLRQFITIDNKEGPMPLDFLGLTDMQEQLALLIDIGETMARKYDVVVTNPPYMGSSGMEGKLSSYVKKHYPDSKADLFAVFIERCGEMTKKNRYQAMITQHAWMFLSSFEKLREKITGKTIVNMAHLGARAFDEIGGEVVQTTSFVLQRSHTLSFKGTYCRLIEPTSQHGKEDLFLSGNNRYTANQDNFSKIPGSPIAYWITVNFLKIFDKVNVARSYGRLCLGMRTGDNERFLRFWHEVNSLSTGFDVHSREEAIQSHKKWFLYNKGGEFRKWYGNIESVVNWENDGCDIKEHTKKVYPQLGDNLGWKISNEDKYFHRGIAWSRISSSYFGVRLCDDNIIFDTNAPMMFPNDERHLNYIAGILTSKIATQVLSIINPTLSFQVGDVAQVPIIMLEDDVTSINHLVNECLEISKIDWNSFEISYEFKSHPLVHYCTFCVEAQNREVMSRECLGLLSGFKTFKVVCNNRFDILKANEEELNRIFIDIYGLRDELTPDVADKDVTVARIYDTKEDIPESMKGNNYVLTKQDVVKSLISYAVGCMFGRYTVDKSGLIYAGGNFDDVYWKYKGQAALNKAGESVAGGYAGISLASYHYPRFRDSEDWKTATKLTFEPDVDNIIPITDEDYFEDDIVGLFCAWLKKVYSSETLEENLTFIAQALGNRGDSSRDIIRNYFLKDFFKDHVKTYKKRPIYWLFDSGKQNGFKALIYLHRYDENTIGNLRVDYLHRMERIYENEITRMQDMADNSTNAREATAAAKRKEKLQKQLKECKEYDEKICHLALARTTLDLDDGVKVNYEKVQTGKDGKKYDVLAKI